MKQLLGRNSSAPANHTLTITDGDGTIIRGKVGYIQPVAERRRKDVAEVHIVASDWLDFYLILPNH